jgi:hypothetical protein
MSFSYTSKLLSAEAIKDSDGNYGTNVPARISLLLNLSACCLKLANYPAVIEHCSSGYFLIQIPFDFFLSLLLLFLFQEFILFLLFLF